MPRKNDSSDRRQPSETEGKVPHWLSGAEARRAVAADARAEQVAVVADCS